MVTWGRAWRAAGAWFGWSFIWGLIGLIFYGIGIVMILGSAVNSINSLSSIFGNPSASSSSFDSTGLLLGVIGGIVLMIIGVVLMLLATMASFFKINSEIVAEAVHRTTQSSATQPVAAPASTPVCPSCGGPLRYIQQNQRWYCDREGKYV